MKTRTYSRLKFGLILGIGTLVALVLCIQCVRTYLYTDAVLVPQQAEREAERQAGELATAARTAGVADARELGPVVKRLLESATDRVLWMRVLDPESKPVAQAGNPQGNGKIPVRWWQKMEKHESLGAVVDTPQGKAWVAMLPFRMPRPPHLFDGDQHPDPAPDHQLGHPGAYIVELAIPLAAVAGSFEGLRQNLIVGVVASIALLVSLAVIGLRAPNYIRGRYLEGELQLARRVQSDLLPQPQSILPQLQFAASTIAADHVGGDFYDFFEGESGKISIVLGDVSGKGVPAALLVSVLQGAIRSSTSSHHEQACERINRMLCERTACERFATLFWGVFDPATRTLRYVNAGHAAPMLIRSGQQSALSLVDGGPVLGMLSTAVYAAGSVAIEPSDLLVLYSDGINEAANQNEEEFGESRIRELILSSAHAAPPEICERLMRRVAAFAGAGVPSDDRTLMVVRFQQAADVVDSRSHHEMPVEAVA